MKALQILTHAFFFSVILFWGCSKNPQENTVVQSLGIDRTNIPLPPGASVDSANITSSTSWTLSGASSWLTVTPSSGTGNTKVYFSATANTTTNSRTSSLVLNTSPAGANPVMVTVLQEQPNVVINFFTSHAPGDSLITINGSGFSGLISENIVKINGALATVVTASTTMLTVRVPAKAGSGFIEVKVNTKSATSAIEFIYDWIGVVTVVAGGTAGNADGVGTSAQFWHPAGIEFDASDNLFIADYANNRVRRMTASLVVTTLPGRIPAVPGGPNTDFGLPQDVVADASGNVYVVEFNSSVISKITPAGIVSVFAGDPTTHGYQDGTGTGARFYQPAGIDIDASGNLIVADTKNHRIRKITPGAIVTTIAGSVQSYADGTGPNAYFNTPSGINVDQAGNYLVTDYYNNRIRKVTPAGVVTSYAGNGSHGSADGTLLTANIYQPIAITSDNNGNIYLSDGNGKLRWISPSGRVSTIIPTITFSSIQGLAIDSNGVLFFADYFNNRICKITIK